MRFYGTSAAEGIPSPFCNCDVCQNARLKGGHEIRRRTMLRINERCSIDLGADAYQQSIEYGNFVHLHHVLITHTHEDHFAHMMMNMRRMAFCRDEETLNLYFTDKAYDIVDFYLKSKPIIKGFTKSILDDNIVTCHRLEFYKTYNLENMEITPLKGNHIGNMNENSANYLIRLEDGKLLYYGLDTGYYLDETIEALSRLKLDYLISECTYGLTEGRGAKPENHLDAYSCMDIFQKLYAKGTISNETKIYLTHINHRTSTHEQLVNYFKQIDFSAKIQVAYDGLTI